MSLIKKATMYVALCAIAFNLASCGGESKTDTLQSKVGQFLEKREGVSATYYAAQGDKVLLSGAVGSPNLDGEKEMLFDQIMPIASSTKQMTAALIMKLVDAKKLDVSDPVSKHLTDRDFGTKMPEWTEKVTIHHLLTHTSALPEYISSVHMDPTWGLEVAKGKILEYLSTAELSGKPGEKFVYGNSGYVLLGAIIEKIHNKPLADIYKDELFTPLGMKSTSLVAWNDAMAIQSGSQPADGTEYAKRYYAVISGKKEKNADTKENTGDAATASKTEKSSSDSSAKNETKSEEVANAPAAREKSFEYHVIDMKVFLMPYADGGIVSTAADMGKWVQALHSGKVMSDASYQSMIKAYYDAPYEGYEDIPNRKVGYGTFVTKLNSGVDLYSHTGRKFAIRSEIGYVPQTKLAYAILSNVEVMVPDEAKASVSFDEPQNQIDIRYFRDEIIADVK